MALVRVRAITLREAATVADARFTARILLPRRKQRDIQLRFLLFPFINFFFYLMLFFPFDLMLFYFPFDLMLFLFPF